MTMAKVRAKIAARKVKAICKRNPERVEQALRAPNWREPKESVSGVCLPQVAIFNARFREKSEVISAR